MGIIRARKEIFEDNYDPDTIVKCFIIIDQNGGMVGVRSIDSSFSAMLTLKS